MLINEKNFKSIALALVGVAILAGCGNNFGLSGSNPFQRDPKDPPSEPTPPPVDTNTFTDKFTQGSSTGGKVDILWVIDDSGSMSDNQINLAANASNFTGVLANLGVDYNLIVISTAAKTDSELTSQCKDELGAPNGDGIITPALLVAHPNAFSDCAILGHGGSGQEVGFEAARRALDPTYMNSEMNGASNPNFLRSDAEKLEIIFVSDEEEQVDADSFLGVVFGGQPAVTAQQVAALKAEMTPHLSSDPMLNDGKYSFFPWIPGDSQFAGEPGYFSYFDGLKPTGEVHAHAIVTHYLDPNLPDGDCHKANANGTGAANGEEIGKRYETLADLTGGSKYDICDEWGDKLTNLGEQVGATKTCFALSHRPTDISSIVGKVNTVVKPGTYKLIKNQYCFTSPPPLGASISISYE